MIAPLHWHDYMIRFGKLDDFVASHPEVSFYFGTSSFCIKIKCMLFMWLSI